MNENYITLFIMVICLILCFTIFFVNKDSNSLSPYQMLLENITEISPNYFNMTAP